MQATAREKKASIKHMSNFFNMDNGLFRALGKLADLMILNILFIVCSIPIFTIGASLTAMYYVTLKMAENEDGYIARAFWKSFRQNFKQATVIWLIMLFFGIILILDLLIMREATGTFSTVLRVVILATSFIYMMVLIYIFPSLARFYNTTKALFKNSFIMAIADFPRTIVMIVITVGSVLIMLINNYTFWYGILVWILAGFALVAFANSFFLKKIFAKYTPKQEEEVETNPDAWSVDDMPESVFDDPTAGAAAEASAEDRAEESEDTAASEENEQ